MNPASCDGISVSLIGKGLEQNLAASLPLAPMRELLRANWYAQDTARSVWDFAMSLTLLLAQGLSECDLRWLWCKGCVEHAVELIEMEGRGRTLRKGKSLQFSPRSLFVLTPKGARWVGQLLSEKPRPQEERVVAGCKRVTVAATPTWDSQLRELRVNQILVKRFLVPAGNQELVLRAFEEENWPLRIDDPLPPANEIEPKRRLHSTIQCLNRNQKTRLLQFHGDGNGSGVRWELLPSRPKSA